MKLSQKINVIFIVFSLITGIVDIVYQLVTTGFGQSVLSSIVIVSLCTAVFFIAVHGQFHRVRTVAHVLHLFINGAVIIFDPYFTLFGLGFAISGLYLAYKYGFLDTYAIPKLLMFSVGLFTLILVSTDLSVNWVRGVIFVAFALFFYAIVYTGEWEVMKKQRQYKQNVEEAMNEIAGERIDLKEVGFTHRELEIGRLLLKTKGADKELAWRLGISTNTMRNHLKSMRTKTRTESKQQLIDSIRWYYHAVEMINESDLHLSLHK